MPRAESEYRVPQYMPLQYPLDDELEPPTKLEIRVLKAVQEAQGDDLFAGPQAVRDRLPNMSREEVDRAMLRLQNKSLVTLQATADTKDKRYPKHEITGYSIRCKDIVGLTIHGSARMQSKKG